VHHDCWTLTSLCAAVTPLHILYEMNRQPQSSRQKCHVWSRTFRFFLICGRLVLLASSERSPHHALDRFAAASD